jgi:hypothetical protein
MPADLEEITSVRVQWYNARRVMHGLDTHQTHRGVHEQLGLLI